VYGYNKFGGVEHAIRCQTLDGYEVWKQPALGSSVRITESRHDAVSTATLPIAPGSAADALLIVCDGGIAELEPEQPARAPETINPTAAANA
jgi:hypothetical protein